MSQQSSQKHSSLLQDEHWRERLWHKPSRTYTVSDHYNGQRFHNLERNPRDRNLLVSWLLARKPSPWPNWVENNLYAKPTARFSENIHDWKDTFINHATVLLQLGSYNILTDPVWSNRVSPFLQMGPKRVRAPGLALDDLPPIDVILVSHNHYDHMDLAALSILEKQHHPLVVTGLGNAGLLRANGLKNVCELDWWESITHHDLTVHFTPAQHFSGRSLRDRNATLWGSFWVGTSAGACYFAGDTGYGKHFTATREQLGAPRLALLPIGAYQPRTIMKPVHMNPKEAVQAHLDLQAQTSLAIHFNTFQLTDEPIHQPVIDLQAALKSQAISAEHFWVLQEGEGRKIES